MDILKFPSPEERKRQRYEEAKAKMKRDEAVNTAKLRAALAKQSRRTE
jgi:hypothetical protein